MTNEIAVVSIIVTIVISVIGGIYKILTDTKKFELTESFRKELMDWYTVVVHLMTEIIHYVELDRFYEDDFTDKRIEMLSKLSAYAEIGRFYFPNVERGFGLHKPSAYQGSRHIVIEFLLHFYFNVRSQKNANVNYLRELERNFTSFIFDMVEPRKRNRDYAKYLDMTIPEGMSMHDYIKKDVKKASVFNDKAE